MKRLAVIVLGVVAALVVSPTVSSADPGPVTIPDGYVYKPSLGVLNDYCTTSPDRPLIGHAQTLRQREVDFRGPCARHDLCYPTDRPINLCHDDFLRNLNQQCDYTFGTDFDSFGESGWRRPCGNLARDYYNTIRVVGNAR